MDAPPRSTRLAWSMTFILFAASVLNYLDRAALAVVMPRVRQDLGLSNTDYGFALNAFLLAYMLAYVAGGRLADRLGIGRTFSASTFVWCASSCLHALAQGLGSLAACRALLGLGEGCFYPTAMRGASEWFAPRDRAKAIGLLLSGVSVGALLTPPVVAWITARHGWRAAFLVTGAFGFLLLPAWALVRRRARAGEGAAPAASGGPETGPDDLPVAAVLRRRKYWAFVLARALSDVAWYFFIFWLPGYYQVVRHFDLAMVGRFLWIPYLCADAGALAGAWSSSALIARGWSVHGARRTALVASAALGAAGGAAWWPASYAASLACVSVALFGHFSLASNLHTVITEIVPARHVAVLYGISGATGTLLAALAQPMLGRVIDRAGYEVPFLVGGACYVAALLLILGAGKIEPLRPAAREATR